MKNKKGFGWLISIAAVAALLYFFILKKEEAPGLIKKAVVEKGDIRNEISATGTINPISTIAVGTQVSGIISKIYVSYNDKVRKGQVIAEIDKTALLASLKEVEASQYRSKVQMEQAQKEYDRNKVLLKEQAITQVEYDQAYYAYLAAEANYNSAVYQADKARTNLQFATIIAPIDGVILSRDINVGQTVAASFNTPTLFTIAQDLTRMEIQANVDEADIGQVKTGQHVHFTVDAFPDDNFTGTVQEIRLQPVTTSNVVTYTVIIDVSNIGQKLMPGMTANVNIVVLESKQVLKVPVAAVKFTPPAELLPPKPERENKGQRQERMRSGESSGQTRSTQLQPGMERFIWLVRNDSLYPAKIRTGISDGSQIEISGDNIHAGDSIAIAYIANAQPEANETTNPFTPKFNRKR